MADIWVDKVNEVWIKLTAHPAIHQAVYEQFTLVVPGFQFSKAYKDHHWDGKVHVYNKRKQFLPAGLFKQLTDWAIDNSLNLAGYTPLSNEFSVNEAKEYINHLNLVSGDKDIQPYDHQLMAFCKAIRYKRCILESATSSGKSLVAYMIMRCLTGKGHRGIIIVPSKGLVEQMYKDFCDYSTKNGWNVESQVHRVYGGRSIYTNKPIMISTWQSIYDLNEPDWWDRYKWVICDEAHKAAAKSLIRIMECLTCAPYRIGMTGTIQDGKVPQLTLEGHFGPIVKIISSKELIDANLAAKLTIKCLLLKHPLEAAGVVSDMDYPNEIQWLRTNTQRNHFIIQLALSLKGNSLILIQSIEHGQNLVASLNKNTPNKAQFVYGGTEVEMREQIRQSMEKQDNAIIVASYGVFQEGVNIKKLNNVIFASPSKSKIRVLQSIGRGLRLSQDKDTCVLYDIADDLRYRDKSNYTLDHYVERVKLYKREEFPIKIYNVELRANNE